MQIILNEFVKRSKNLFIGRYKSNLYSSYLLCRKYSSTSNRVDDVVKSELPVFVQTRSTLWNQLKQKYDAQIEAKSYQSIKVRLSDGTIKSASAWKSTPHEIINEINDKSLNRAIIAKVNGILWDLKRPLETDCTLDFIPFDDIDGRHVFWHSSAHVLGKALEQLYGGLLCNGPSTENGFYYDIFTNEVTVIISGIFDR